MRDTVDWPSEKYQCSVQLGMALVAVTDITLKSNGWRMRACASPCEWADAASDREAVLKKGAAVSESYLKVTRYS